MLKTLLKSHSLIGDDDIDVDTPDWVKGLCQRRNVLFGSVLRTSFEDGADVYYFVYGRLSPVVAYFLPLTRSISTLPCLALMTPEETLEAWGCWNEWQFECEMF